MVVVRAWYGKKYRLKEITWNESERARTRATWMNTLRNDRICREKLRLDIRCFEKLCHVLQTKGFASDPPVLRDALRRPNGLKVPKNKYLLVDLGYSNAEGFLAPYKGTRYHLNLWRGNTPTNEKELFNLRHSSARNTIERAFGWLKKRLSILRNSSFFPKKIQVRIINACLILHNFLREENMEETSLMQEVDHDLINMEAIDEEEVEEDYILSARTTNEWNKFRDDLA
ncbi:uncharacterized protein LOC110693939 [Chenopodium quinoa]|uniref:uncharacterized protein LOC110693939 n=1 Tax=Chenopodium quinoa TaxID=63459 RepID=UPI000B780BC4|nr:uncharacterized protein LOC110693939 [Chenopodium quinoa]